jgi:RNA polymerase sigma-70 factor, ECF subfamily
MSVTNDSLLHDRFAELFARHHRRIYTYISSLLVRRDEVDDVFQQTCMVLWKKWDQYSPELDFASWGCGIARNEVRNFLRVRKGKAVHLSEQVMDKLSDEHFELDHTSDERRQALLACLGKLPERQRKLIEGCYRGSLPVRAIAESMRLAPSALYMKLHRIRRALLDCITLTMSGGE